MKWLVPVIKTCSQPNVMTFDLCPQSYGPVHLITTNFDLTKVNVIPVSMCVIIIVGMYDDRQTERKL